MPRMNGQLSEQPLAELIREISAKSLGGRLRLEHDRVKVVAYFDNGNFLYAASNVRTLRLREYLLKSNLVSTSRLSHSLTIAFLTSTWLKCCVRKSS